MQIAQLVWLMIKEVNIVTKGKGNFSFCRNVFVFSKVVCCQKVSAWRKGLIPFSSVLLVRSKGKVMFICSSLRVSLERGPVFGCYSCVTRNRSFTELSHCGSPILTAMTWLHDGPGTRNKWWQRWDYGLSSPSSPGPGGSQWWLHSGVLIVFSYVMSG